MSWWVYILVAISTTINLLVVQCACCRTISAAYRRQPMWVEPLLQAIADEKDIRDKENMQALKELFRWAMGLWNRLPKAKLE
jgi:hypothetical protein